MPSRLVKMDEVEPGVKVVKDVVDARGMLLFKAGVALSPAMIERVRARNVTHIFVEDEGAAVGMSEEDLAAKQDEMETDLDKLFEDVADQPLMAELREAAKVYLKDHLGT